MNKYIAGWKLNDSNDVLGIYYSTTFETDATLHAIWEDAITAKLDVDGKASSNNGDQIIYKGQSAYLPSLNSDDNTEIVIGWHIGSPDGEMVKAPSFVEIDENTTFYAEWANTCKVTFHANDSLAKTIYTPKNEPLFNFGYILKYPNFYGDELDSKKNFKEWRINGIDGEILTENTPIISDIDVYAVYEGDSPNITVISGNQQITIPTDAGFIDKPTLFRIVRNRITIPEGKILYDLVDDQNNYYMINEVRDTGYMLKVDQDTTLNVVLCDTVNINLHQANDNYVTIIPVPKGLDFTAGLELFINYESRGYELHLGSEDGPIIYSCQTMNLSEDIDIYVKEILNKDIISFRISQKDLSNQQLYGMVWVPDIIAGKTSYQIGDAGVGDNINISLDESFMPEGKQFKEWFAFGDAEILDKYALNTSFVCKSNNYGNPIFIYPIFEDKPEFEAGLVNDENGLRYLDSNGEYAKSTEINLDDDIYYFDENGYAVKNQWQHILGGKGAAVLDIYRYFGPDYKAVKNQWVDGCYLNEYGVRAENQIIGVYYVGSDGKYVKSKWVEIEGNYYCFDSTGKMVKNQWVGNYYLLSTGIMATNQWIGNYYVGADGAWIPNAPVTKWVKEGNNWKYLNTKTNTYSTSKWEKINNVWYYFNEESIMVTGLNTIEGKKYYFNSTGAMKTGWIKTDNQWYYFASNGAAVKGWLKINNVWYYFNEKSIMITGLNTIENKEYYFNPSGTMVTGWVKLNNKWYYFQSSGAMAKSQWIQDYYLKENGEMATSEIVGMYYVDSTGAYVKNKWVLIGEDYYYFDGSGKMVKNKWIGNYYLGFDGKMARGTWIGVYYVDENGQWVPGKEK